MDGEHAERLYGLATRCMLYRTDLEQQGQSTERGNELITESGLWKDRVCYWRLHGRRRVVNASSMPQRSRRQQPFCRHTVVAAAYVESVPRWLVVGSRKQRGIRRRLGLPLFEKSVAVILRQRGCAASMARSGGSQQSDLSRCGRVDEGVVEELRGRRTKRLLVSREKRSSRKAADTSRRSHTASRRWSSNS